MLINAPLFWTGIALFVVAFAVRLIIGMKLKAIRNGDKTQADKEPVYRRVVIGASIVSFIGITLAIFSV